MNKKGQTLIIFVILIPIIITMLAVVVDVGILNNSYQKTKNIVDDGIKEYLKTKENKIEELLKMNGILVDEIEIKEENEKIEVSLQYQIDSLFGKIIHINQYEIEINRIGKKEQEKIIISKKE